MINVRDIQIRDPFIYCDPLSRKYYMYGTTDRDCWGGPGVGFDVYVSDDLQSWEGPFEAFRPQDGFWGHPKKHSFMGKMC